MSLAGGSFNSLFWDRGFRVSENSLSCDTYYHSGKFTVRGRPAVFAEDSLPEVERAHAQAYTYARGHSAG